jgi:Zn finger protein HypA/HybF involved in hydrogenase expression
MSELSKLYACLKIAEDDGSYEEVEFWLKEIEKERGCTHKKTVSLNEEGHAGIFCVNCNEKLEDGC